MDLSLYQKMVGRSRSVTQAYVNDSISHVNSMFDKSPSFKKIELDGIITDAILNRKKSKVIDVLFRPQTVVNKGMYATVDEDTFLLTEFIPNEIYPKATIELCNATLRWKDSDESIMEYKCIVKGNSFEQESISNDRIERFVITSESEITIHVQYNDDTKKIKPSQRFIFGNSAFEVISIDEVTEIYNSKGILKLGVRYTNITDTDDRENKVADSSGNSGWSEWE